jgi:hypothetical protein
MEKTARQREGGERAAVSLETSSSRLDDELWLDLLGQRRTKLGLALAFQRDGRGCGGGLGSLFKKAGRVSCTRPLAAKLDAHWLERAAHGTAGKRLGEATGCA